MRDEDSFCVGCLSLKVMGLPVGSCAYARFNSSKACGEVLEYRAVCKAEGGVIHYIGFRLRISDRN
jgi:hypothetical protein